VKRVIPRAHMASATKIYLKQVGLDNFEPSPASPIHAVRTSAGDHATEYAEEHDTGDPFMMCWAPCASFTSVPTRALKQSSSRAP
jgi:hypothetical protein